MMGNFYQKIITVVFILLMIGCAEQTATNQQDGTKDTLALPDARSGGVKIQQFHRGQVTTEIVADSVNNFETNDSTVAYVVDVDIFDSTGAVSSEVVGDSAVFREGQENLEIFGNVVVTNRDSIIVETEYLRWNPVNEKIESDKFVKVTMGKQVQTGWGLEADRDLFPFKIFKSSGTIHDVEKDN